MRSSHGRRENDDDDDDFDGRRMSADYGTSVEIEEDEAKYNHARPSRCCVRYGNTWVVCSLSEKYGMFPLTCHLGPNWPCMLVTYCIAIAPLFLFFMYAVESMYTSVCIYLFGRVHKV